MCPSNNGHGPHMVQCHLHEILGHRAVYIFFGTTLSFYNWMKIINDVLWMNVVLSFWFFYHINVWNLLQIF